MSNTYYRGLGLEHIKTAAENGSLRGSSIGEDERFDEMDVEISVYGKDKAVWITDSVASAKIYGWGGGYFEIDPSKLKVVNDRKSCYGVVMTRNLDLDHVVGINLENKDDDRDHLMEVAHLLDERHSDIELSSYEPETYSV